MDVLGVLRQELDRVQHGLPEDRMRDRRLQRVGQPAQLLEEAREGPFAVGVALRDRKVLVREFGLQAAFDLGKVRDAPAAECADRVRPEPPAILAEYRVLTCASRSGSRRSRDACGRCKRPIRSSSCEGSKEPVPLLIGDSRILLAECARRRSADMRKHKRALDLVRETMEVRVGPSGGDGPEDARAATRRIVALLDDFLFGGIPRHSEAICVDRPGGGMKDQSREVLLSGD